MTRTNKIVIGVIIGVLVVCLAIAGLVFGAAAIGWKAAVRAGNEAAAMQNLKTIAALEIQYYNTHHREFGTFDDLVSEGFLSARFKGQAPVVDGYVFTLTITPKAENTRARYVLNGDPQDNSTGTNHFYLDSSSSEIRFNPNRRAGPNDPLL
jgi:Tfp pilus assembly protein PilE